MEQRSPEWFAARLGRVTASKIADVIAKTKTGYGASRDDYMTNLILERMTGAPTESISNQFMEWGTQQEPFARAEYEKVKEVLVDEVGIIYHPTIEMTGASPDGLVGDDGLVEIKCPSSKTHMATILSQTIAGKYFAQMQWQLCCTKRSWCDFVSFDPRMPEGLKLYIKRVERDDKYISMLEEEVIKFLQELEVKLNQLMKVQNV